MTKDMDIIQIDIKLTQIDRNKGQIPGVPKNPRRISKQKLEGLKRSIIELPGMMELRELLVYPLNDRYVVLDGNMRHKALESLGFKTAKCKIVPSDTPPAVIKKIILTANNSFGEDSIEDLLKGWGVEELKALSYDIPEYHNSDVGYANEDEDVPLSPKKHKKWGEGVRKNEARCDLVPRIGIINRSPYMILHSFKRTEEGELLTEIKSEKNVIAFASAACTMIRGVVQCGRPEEFALVNAPSRRHKEWNFAISIGEKIAKLLGVKYYPDAFSVKNRNRINPEFTLKANIKEPNVILYDDILTTGSTIRGLARLLNDRNLLVVIGINNN